MRSAPGLPIIPYPSFRLGPPAADPSRGQMPLRWLSGSLAEEGSNALSLNVGWVKGLLSFHQRPGNHQHLGSDLDQHLGADAFLPLPTVQ